MSFRKILPNTAPPARKQSLDTLRMMDERRANDVGTNASDVAGESARDRIRTSNMEANA